MRAMGTRNSTAIELVDVLRRLDQTLGVQRIIRRAQVGHYHDYVTDAACPKVELVNDLRSEMQFHSDAPNAHGFLNYGILVDLEKAVMRGEYDEDPDDRRLPRVED